jgi:pyruvate kinase
MPAHDPASATLDSSDVPLRVRKRTKIVATLGPACDDPAVLRAMLEAGVNVVRLNMSHGNLADHERRLNLVRQLSRELNRPVASLADLQGPKIRLGKLAGDQPVTWVPGRTVVITTADCPDGGAERVGTSYLQLHQDVRPGDRMLVDDGRMELRVERVDGQDVHCRIITGGLLKSRKGLNLPGVKVSAPSLSDKDKEDLSWAITNEVDYIALSFVRQGRDVRHVRNRIAESGKRIPVIAKIERAEAVAALDEILAEADGIMVARGDLGVEISLAALPVVQKELILRANRMGKLVITATQMLESMIENDIPTRAEATDIANAVFDGTDAVMLSGETAAGKHPVAAVAAMTRILLESEASRYVPSVELDPSSAHCSPVSRSISGAAHQLSRELEADAIVVFSRRSEKALLLSKRRGRIPMIAVCHDERQWRAYCLFWGVVAELVPQKENLQDLLETGIEAAVQQKLLRDGQNVVVIFGFSDQGVVSLRLHQV